MKTRVISGIFIVIFTLGLVWLGGLYLAGALLAISICAYFELCHATKVSEPGKVNALEVVTSIVIAGYYALVYFVNNPLYSMLVIVLLLIIHMFVYVLAYPKYHADQIMKSYFSFVYAPVMLSFITMTRQMSGKLDTDANIIGFYAVWMIFISAWFSDTMAYFTGVCIGKHKAFPVLSPKKTIEGCVGGICGGALGGYLYGLVLTKCGVMGSEIILPFVLLGFVGSIVGMIGDLAASAIKRNYEIKDYGKIIPGHGGFMDRFDSIIFTAPLVYILATFFIL